MLFSESNVTPEQITQLTKTAIHITVKSEYPANHWHYDGRYFVEYLYGVFGDLHLMSHLVVMECELKDVFEAAKEEGLEAHLSYYTLYEGGNPFPQVDLAKAL